MRDRHCHILFDVDDGAQDISESLRMLKAALDVGITEIVATPHFRGQHFNEEKIRHNFDVLKREFNKYAPHIKIELGFEVYYFNIIDVGIENASKYAVESTGDFLLELPIKNEPLDLERTIYSLMRLGLTVFIAHPERYQYIQKDINKARLLKNQNCKLLLSADFLAQSMFSPIRRCANKLIKEDLAYSVASDAHFSEHYKYLNQALNKYKNKFLDHQHVSEA